MKTRIATYVAFILLVSALAVAQPVGAAAPRGNVIRGLFDVGGYSLYLRCNGEGSPTVVMDAGGNEDSSTWSDVRPSLVRLTRVCVYDRAGLGRSEPGPVPRTSQTMVDDLTTLLSVANVPGPYVLVGHSFAGWIVQLFAREDDSDAVVGVVLVDTMPPGIVALYDSLGIPIPAPDDTEENPEGLDFRVSAELVLTAGPFPAVPLVVLTHGSPPGDPDPVEEAWQEMQVEQSELSPMGQLIVARKSGHFIHNDQPRLVFRAIRKVIRQARDDALA
jgi:pimeloyl-ACP methyl ester carboxylesterase